MSLIPTTIRAKEHQSREAVFNALKRGHRFSRAINAREMAIQKTLVVVPKSTTKIDKGSEK